MQLGECQCVLWKEKRGQISLSMHTREQLRKWVMKGGGSVKYVLRRVG